MIAPRFAPLAFVLAFVSPVSAATRYDPDLAGAVRDVAGRLREVRGAVPGRVPLPVRSDADARREAARGRRDAALPPSRLSARGRAWADLGFGTADDPARLYSLLATDLEDWVLSADGKRILVADDRLTDADLGGPDGDAAAADLLFATGTRADEPSAAHVVVHALQEERGAGPGLRETTDATLAASAWREGEANLVALLLVYGGMGLEGEVIAGRATPGLYRDGELIVHAPAGSSSTLARLLDFVYAEGFQAAARRVREGGWAAVERAVAIEGWTSALLHLERTVRPVAPVEAPSLPLPPGYRLADRDALGEFALGVLVAEGTGKENLGWIAADGWQGDGLFRFESSEPAEGVTFWRTRWRTEADAEDFRYAMTRVLSGTGKPAGEETGAERVFRAGRRVTRLLGRGTGVDLRVAPEEVDAALGSLLPEPVRTKETD